MEQTGENKREILQIPDLRAGRRHLRTKMQRNDVVDNRPRSRTYPLSTSISKHPTKAKGGGDEDDKDSTSSRSTGYNDDSYVKLANQSEERNLRGVMDRLRVAKSRAKVDRNQETMRLRKDCWILESQRKAMTNSTVAFSDLLRSTRMKNARAAAQMGDAESTSSGCRTPDGSPPMSPRLHTKLLRWRGTALTTQEAPSETPNASSDDNTNRLPVIPQTKHFPHQQRQRPGTAAERPATTADRVESEVDDNGRGYRTTLGYIDRLVTSGHRRQRSQSLRIPSSSEQDTSLKSSRETGQAANSVLLANTITKRALLQRRPKTAASKLALKSEDIETDVMEKAETVVEETENLKDTSSAVGTPPSSRRRARSMSYMTPAQSSISASGKVRAVNEKTISLHGRTTRELRKMTHIDSIAAAESEERRKQIEERKREMKENERMKLQEKVDNFLKKLDAMTKEELDAKRSLYSGLTVSF